MPSTSDSLTVWTPLPRTAEEVSRLLGGALSFQQALRRFYADLRGRKFRLIRPVSVHEWQAIRLLVRKGSVLPLRTLDALQLSAALWLKSQQQLDHFLCADPKLCEVAQQEGLSVINPEAP